MKLLFVTQVVDKDDAVLGAYHGWVGALAETFESVTVICLREGAHDLPANAAVYSLGKEKGPVSRWRYAARFLRIVWRLRRQYDAVFVHMNQEYLLLAGWLWSVLGKKMYLWRNHYAGSFLTDMAAGFCTKIFCTSRYSYTAKYRKTILMPVGVDTRRFAPDPGAPRRPRSILFLARMAPSKRAEVLIEALGMLTSRGVEYAADFYGSPLPGDEAYYRELAARVEKMNLADRVHFYPSVPNAQAPGIYRAHEIFVNASPSGMFDKTLFEAAACGALPVASSRDWAALAGSTLSFDGSAPDLADTIARLLDTAGGREREARLERLARSNSLAALVGRLAEELGAA